MPVTLTTRVDDDIAKLIDKIAKKEGMDRSTVMRRFLIKAIREWMIESNLEDYKEGKISLWEAAKRSNISLYEMLEEIKKRGVHINYNIEDLKKDLEAL